MKLRLALDNYVLCCLHNHSINSFERLDNANSEQRRRYARPSVVVHTESGQPLGEEIVRLLPKDHRLRTSHGYCKPCSEKFFPDVDPFDKTDPMIEVKIDEGE